MRILTRHCLAGDRNRLIASGITEQNLDGIPQEDLLNGLASFEKLGGSVEYFKRMEVMNVAMDAETRRARGWESDLVQVRVNVTDRVSARFHLFSGPNNTAPNPVNLTGVGSNGGREERIDGLLEYASWGELQAATNTVVLQSTNNGVSVEFSINSRVLGRFTTFSGGRILSRFYGSGVCTWT